MRTKALMDENGILSDDVPFGDPPIMYKYRCRSCGYECEINEAVVDAAYGWTRKRTVCGEGRLPVMECHSCGKEDFICIG